MSRGTRIWEETGSVMRSHDCSAGPERSICSVQLLHLRQSHISSISHSIFPPLMYKIEWVMVETGRNLKSRRKIEEN